MKKLTLIVAGLAFAATSFACDGKDKKAACCKGKNKSECKKEAKSEAGAKKADAKKA